MGNTLSTLLITIFTFVFMTTSCISCATYVKRNVVFPVGAVANQQHYMHVAMVKTTPGINGHEGSQGTAWAIDNDYLVTAGHICDNHEEQFELGLVGPELTLIQAGSDGLEWDQVTARILGKDSERDVCILESVGHPFVPVILAENLDYVESGDPVSVTGAPRHAFPVRSDGFIISTEAPRFAGAWGDMLYLKIDIDHGSSGSPVFWAGKVIGMTVVLPRFPPHTSLAVPVEHIHDLIDDLLD